MPEILYYSNNNLPEQIMTIVQEYILKSGFPILSVTLKPMNFGRNFVVDLKPGVITMFRQILFGLEKCKEDVIFMAEHDVLYHKSHFDFIPPKKDVFYYNSYVWRWWFPYSHFITYDNIVSTSGLCANREFLLSHYQKRLKIIKERGLEDGHNPYWVRKMGYEPGKSKERGGEWDEKVEERKSEYPNIDIRHGRTLTATKVTLDRFRVKPGNWKQIGFDQIPEWDLQGMFNL